MQYHKKILSLALAAALLTLAGCGSRQEDPAGSQDQSNAQPAGVAVQVQTVTSETISADNTVSGSVAADDEASVFVATTAKCTAV